ncbi:3'(2'),5'-bisphosphate nucleotidase 1 isoform X2 [Aethina tumida]|nr:3'(2'),5'-bisphosphate nucleotidase 1 isoform X2 [Aethina tumida]XP_019881571.1 3'(2'),5'-bisphosphate nucleotidase 1 isoform X2 [Aethina tumida]
MAQNKPLVQRVLASSASVAVKAGEIIRNVMKKGDLGTVDKGVDDLQTAADRSAQCCIISNLYKQFPKITIIGEEGPNHCKIDDHYVGIEGDAEILAKECPTQYLDVKDEDIVVWVDPLDGTNEYTKGLLDHVTVLIGIAVNGRAVGGVVHQPYYNFQNNEDTCGRTLWGLVGMGVGGFTPSEPPKDKFIVTTTRSHNSDVVMRCLEAVKPDEVLRVGGAGHKVLLVLEGKAHAYIYPSAGCKKWDTCAPEAILEAAGGKLTDIFGEHYSYNKDVEFPDEHGIVASNGAIDHTNLLQKIPQDVLNKFSKIKN